MSKFTDKAENFYMDKFDAMFESDEKEAKEKAEMIEKFKVADEELFLEDVITDIADSAEETSNILFNTKKPEVINEEGEFGEEEEEEEETFDDPDDEPIEDDEEVAEDDMDEMDEADEILEEIDLGDINNDTRIELIRNIIDSAQNQAGEDEEMTFDDFISGLNDVIDEFQYDETEGEEDEEMADEEDEDFGIDEEGDDEMADDDMGENEDFGDEEDEEELV